MVDVLMNSRRRIGVWENPQHMKITKGGLIPRFQSSTSGPMTTAHEFGHERMTGAHLLVKILQFHPYRNWRIHYFDIP